MKYEPSETEKYMNDNQIQYFKRLLVNEKKTLNDKLLSFTSAIRTSNQYEANDVVSRSDIIYKELQENKEAMERIEDGTYGYCEESGEEIGIRRLKIRPSAKYCIQVQEKLERRQKMCQPEDNEYY